ncbi:MAG: hypothetical protein HY897_04040 [Deltaproteobacteria bacterium]|nr:hypothetical protein [Deltaproteobacteria bacterium]
MADKLKTADVDPQQGPNFLIKAAEFAETMENCVAQRKWNAAALNAIHSGICACDAVTSSLGGLRSKSQRHEDAVRLLKSTVRAAGTDEAANHLHQLLRAKHNVEYEGRLFTQSETLALANHSRKFLAWARGLLP